MIDESWLWHRSLGHLNFVKISKKEAVRDLPKIEKPLNLVCIHCKHGKRTSASFKTKEVLERKGRKRKIHDFPMLNR